MRDSVRVVVCGDAQVGKTSIVIALYSHTFQESNVMAVLPRVTIPPSASPEKVATHIIDTSSREQDARVVDAELKKADVVCLVYDVARKETFARAESFWLPRIREANASKALPTPVILIGNKIDTRVAQPSEVELELAFAPLTAKHRELECVAECSAKQLLHIEEIFYFAQKAVLYPSAVLVEVDRDARRLRPACVKALHRIFQLCDIDNDGVLNDEELNGFQRRVFDAALSPAEIDGVKREVRKADAAGVSNGGLTVFGFVALHQVFVQKGRLETVWSVLRQFGYGDDLELEPRYLCPEVDVDENEPCELSASGVAFFAKLFARFARSSSPASSSSSSSSRATGPARLSLAELQQMFATTPGVPWGAAFNARVSRLGLDADEFEAQWRATTLYDWKTTLMYAAYFGYAGDTTQLLRFGAIGPNANDAANGPTSSNPTTSERRSTFLCYVMGPNGAGKSRLLHGNEQSTSATAATTTSAPRAVVVPVDDRRVVLALHEVDYASALPPAAALARSDLLCFMYDASDKSSFAAVVAQYASVEAALSAAQFVMPPCCVIANKADREAAVQSSNTSPDEFCELRGLPPPVSVSLDAQSPAIVHVLLVKTIESWQPQARNGSASAVFWGMFGLAVIVAAAGGALLYSMRHSSTATTPDAATPSN